MTFGDTLRKLISERDISQKKLASDLNIAPSTIGNYIQNTREPDFETLKLFATYFGVTVDYLICYIPDTMNLSAMETDLLRVFRSLTPEQQSMYLEQGKAVAKINYRKPR